MFFHHLLCLPLSLETKILHDQKFLIRSHILLACKLTCFELLFTFKNTNACFFQSGCLFLLQDLATVISFPQRVAEVSDSWWHSMLILPPLLKESPASPFLAAYYPDCVGMSPPGSSSSASSSELKADAHRAVHPQSEFVKAAEQGALCKMFAQCNVKQ